MKKIQLAKLGIYAVIDTSTSLSINGERPSTSLKAFLSERSESNGRSRTIDCAACGKKSLVNIAESCVKAGVKIIQLRDKTEDVQGFYRNALLIREITKGKALFIINDRLDIAKLVNADGLHLGQDDLPIKPARKILGPDKIIGKSCHSLSEAISAQKEGADYISIGPIFKTPTKPEYRPVGLRLLRELGARLKVPVVAIGGINKDNIRLVREAGAKIIAVVRPICTTGNVVKAVSELAKGLWSPTPPRRDGT